MSRVNYIIFHPEKYRQQVTVSAYALVNDIPIDNWKGTIWVDKIGEGNEDPFVFCDPWLFSFCRAAQLRQSENSHDYLQVGSKLIFVNGNDANNNILTIDTVFVVDQIQKWTPKPNLSLPEKYKEHYKNRNSDLWMRHFRFPFCKIHDSVTRTYEASQYTKKEIDLSFLPINKNGNRVSIDFNSLNANFREKIVSNVYGKLPVLLYDTDVNTLYNLIKQITVIKVIKNIRINTNINYEIKRC